MVTTESNAIRCKELVMRLSGFRVFAAVIVGFLGFCMTINALCHPLMLGCTIFAFIIPVLDVGCGCLFIYTAVQCAKRKNDGYPVNVMKPIA